MASGRVSLNNAVYLWYLIKHLILLYEDFTKVICYHRHRHCSRFPKTGQELDSKLPEDSGIASP